MKQWACALSQCWKATRVPLVLCGGAVKSLLLAHLQSFVTSPTVEPLSTRDSKPPHQAGTQVADLCLLSLSSILVSPESSLVQLQQPCLWPFPNSAPSPWDLVSRCKPRFTLVLCPTPFHISFQPISIFSGSLLT